MPSHLGEEGKEEAKATAIRNGVVTEEHIQGKDAADVLAKAGVDLHESNKHHAEEARDRKAITVITQKMMLHVWESYVDFSDSKVQKKLQMDDDEVYRMMLKAKFE